MSAELLGPFERDPATDLSRPPRPEERVRKWDMSSTAWVREIVPGLFLGNIGAACNAEVLRTHRITSIVSLADARWQLWDTAPRAAGVPAERHLWIRCLDALHTDLLQHLGRVCAFIDHVAPPALQASVASRRRGLSVPPSSLEAAAGAVLVHCDLGGSRSPTAITAYLMHKYAAGCDDALALVQSKQPVRPNPSFARQLRVWEACQCSVWTDDTHQVSKPPYQAFLDELKADVSGVKAAATQPA